MTGSRPLVILGARGLVGSALMRAMAAEAPIALNSGQCDLTRPGQILKVMDKLRPRIFVNCAAYTDVDGCESDPEAAQMVNGVGPGHLAQAARDIDCRLVHLSTDFVFDGSSDRPYREDDPTRPQSVYGRTKLAGEEAVKKAGGGWLIVRTAWVYGHPRLGFPWRMLEFAQEGRALRVVADQTGSPTYAEDLAQGLAELIRAKADGMVHLCGGGQTTWWGLARRTLDLAGLGSIEIEKISSDELGRPAPRPAYSVLDTKQFEHWTGRKPRHWEDALAQAVKKELEDERR